MNPFILLLDLDEKPFLLRVSTIYGVIYQSHPEDHKLPLEERRECTMIICDAPTGLDPQGNPTKVERWLCLNSIEQIAEKLNFFKKYSQLNS